MKERLKRLITRVSLYYRRKSSVDLVFKGITAISSFLTVIIFLWMIYYLYRSSGPSIQKFGINFLFTSVWDPVFEEFGALTFIYGTIISSLLALLIAVPLSLGIAIFLSELAPSVLKGPISFLIELLAAIPSVIYGLWGIFVLAPFLRIHIEPLLAKYLGFLPIFKGEIYGIGMLAAGIILSIMIIPTISTICYELFLTIPYTQKEAALALGATKWEMIRISLLRYARSGILGAIILGLGRAIGETMAVTMVIGNRPEINASLFAPGYTMASVIANEFTEATTDLYLSALFEIGLILLLITLLLNIFARVLIWSVSKKLVSEAKI